jgi:hypothetical protein
VLSPSILAVSIKRVPPCGIASRALMAMFKAPGRKNQDYEPPGCLG